MYWALTNIFPLAITSFSFSMLLSETFSAVLPVAHRVRRATSVSHILHLVWETSPYPKRLRSFGEMRVNTVDMYWLIGIRRHVAESDWSICWVLFQGNWIKSLVWGNDYLKSTHSYQKRLKADICLIKSNVFWSLLYFNGSFFFLDMKELRPQSSCVCVGFSHSLLMNNQRGQNTTAAVWITLWWSRVNS